MSEDEQWEKIRPFIDADGDTYERGVYSKCLRRQVLADLAFRLRDEVAKVKDLSDIFNPTKLTIAYFDAFMDICDYYKYPWSENEGDVYTWIMYCAKPIHWIIAALIAKDKETD